MTYSLYYDDEVIATVEIADTINTHIAIREMVEFWSNWEIRLRAEKDDYTKCWLKQLGRAIIHGGDGTMRTLGEQEGWCPLDGTHGIKVTNVSVPELDEDLIWIKEMVVTTVEPKEDEPQPKLIQNAIRIKADDTYLKSCHTHDYVSHAIGDQEWFVDGGLDYVRRGWGGPVTKDSFEDYCLREDSPIDEIRAKLLWGTRGPKGDQPLTYRPLCSFTVSHLEAILAIPEVKDPYRAVAAYWVGTTKTPS